MHSIFRFAELNPQDLEPQDVVQLEILTPESLPLTSMEPPSLSTILQILLDRMDSLPSELKEIKKGKRSKSHRMALPASYGSSSFT